MAETVAPNASDVTEGTPTLSAEGAVASKGSQVSEGAPAVPSEGTLALPAEGERLSSDEILDRFVAWVSGKGLALYPAQEEAVLELLADKHCILSTPTGSGKSLVAFALHYKALCEGRRSIYTCPIKALVNEKFFDLCAAFGPENVGMMTGDAAVNRDAPILCCTAEVLSNMALREASLDVAAVVMDEFHYYADRDRGVAWQLPLLLLEQTQFLLMSATLGDTSTIEERLADVTSRETARIHSGDRPVPLDFEYRETPLHETIEELVAANRHPIYLVSFTQRAAAEQAQALTSVNFCSKEEKEAIRQALNEARARFDSPFGKDMQKYLKHGLGLHHAGLLPKYRLMVERLAQAGHLKIVSGTDTLGVGVNIPIRTVLFTQLCKYDGQKTAILSVRDFLQIAGRAGRKGFDDRGWVVAQAPEHVIENKRLVQKAAAKGTKKIVKKQPPQKGFVPWDVTTFQRLQESQPEPLESRFQVNFGMVLNLLQSDTTEPGFGYGRLVRLVRRSHERPHVQLHHLKQAASQVRTLRGAGVVELVRGTQWRAPHLTISGALQREFSLHQTLSLWLLDTLPKLERDSEAYALDVLTLVESILENPDVVLRAQLRKLKDDAVAQMKAEGVEYEERMKELEKIEYPKPHRDFIYDTFNAFAARHPWVGTENIRPKGVVREMFERFVSFQDFVRDYGLQRSEGALLRYVSEVYKTLLQSVPESFKDEALDDMTAQLRLMLRQVDSSLIDEWERLMSPDAEGPVEPGAEVTLGGPKPYDPAADPRAFRARVRGELHRLLRALADRQYAEALTFLAPGEIEWTEQSLEEAMAAYFEAHGEVVLTPSARTPRHTFLAEEGTRRWSARQKIVDPQGEEDWMLDCVVDLSDGAPEDVDAPLIELLRIGT